MGPAPAIGWDPYFGPLPPPLGAFDPQPGAAPLRSRRAGTGSAVAEHSRPRAQSAGVDGSVVPHDFSRAEATHSPQASARADALPFMPILTQLSKARQFRRLTSSSRKQLSTHGVRQSAACVVESPPLKKARK